MADKCAFCNTAICFGGAEENGKSYHAKCTPSARGVDIDALTAAKLKEEQVKRQAEYSGQPDIIGQLEVGTGPDGRRAGLRVDPVTGEKKYVSYQPDLGKK